jgi:hypothetical protein
VLVTAESSQDYFTENFRWQPWLAVPFTHTQKRQQLRELFEVDTSKDIFVLISPDGTTITRDGATLMSLAWQCQQAINNSDSHGSVLKMYKPMIEQVPHAHRTSPALAPSAEPTTPGP